MLSALGKLRAIPSSASSLSASSLYVTIPYTNLSSVLNKAITSFRSSTKGAKPC